jgi:hypothetical protein
MRGKKGLMTRGSKKYIQTRCHEGRKNYVQTRGKKGIDDTRVEKIYTDTRVAGLKNEF